MSERTDRTHQADDQPRSRDEEMVSDELGEELEEVSGGTDASTKPGNNFNCGCS